MGGSHAVFPPTQWKLVLTARHTAGADAFQALETLCRDYWYPIYAFIRRRGHAPHEAQDLTQGFFANLLQREWLEKVAREEGRFRTFLLHCLTNFLINEWKKEHGPQRQPAGGIVPLEIGDAEERYAHEPLDDATPEKLFQRRWVATLLEQVKARLRAECERSGKLPLFEKVEPLLGDRAERGSISEIAATLAMSEGALRVAIHRMRQHFGQLLRAVVAETLADPSEVEPEIRSLFTAWN